MVVIGPDSLTCAAKRVSVFLERKRKGKPLARGGRKATGLPELAGPPKSLSSNSQLPGGPLLRTEGKHAQDPPTPPLGVEADTQALWTLRRHLRNRHCRSRDRYRCIRSWDDGQRSTPDGGQHSTPDVARFRQEHGPHDRRHKGCDIVGLQRWASDGG